MIRHLEIADIVLVEKLALSFGPGLTVLTGETGAGKSILLDALGLVLGARAESDLVRTGRDFAMVTAEISLESDHSCLDILTDHGLDVDTRESGSLIVRRRVQADGGSRAWVNDSPVSAGLLKQIGQSLFEIQGQFETLGLLNPAGHAEHLDRFGGLMKLAEQVSAGWQGWMKAKAAFETAQADHAQGERDRDELERQLEALTALNPVMGEAQQLEDERRRLMNLAGLQQGLDTALNEIESSDGAEARVSRAERALSKLDDPELIPALEALGRCSAELSELGYLLSGVRSTLPEDESGLEAVDNRLQALRGEARVHSVEIDELPDLKDTLAKRLDSLETAGDHLADLQQQEQAARSVFLEASGELGKQRLAAAQELEAAMHEELPDLKLEAARFVCACTQLPEEKWGPNGTGQVRFLLSANPGIEPTAIHKSASGGELARITLALKVALTRQDDKRSHLPTLIFDEVDSGIGGATADAVGRRLARLATAAQILVVTHSPQVAARGQAHYRVSKAATNGDMRSTVENLDPQQRQEEIARMLAGETITTQARAAAASLLSGSLI